MLNAQLPLISHILSHYIFPTYIICFFSPTSFGCSFEDFLWQSELLTAHASISVIQPQSKCYAEKKNTKKKKRRRLFCLKFSNNQLSLNNLLDLYCIYFFHCFCICSSQREYCTSMIWSLAFRKTDVDIFIFFIITNSFYLLQYIRCSGSTIVGIGSPDPPQFVYDDEEYHDVFLSGEPRKRIPHSWTVVLKMFL